MSARCWNLGHSIASKQNRQLKKDVTRRDTGAGNGTQPSVILKILDNCIFPFMKHVVKKLKIICNSIKYYTSLSFFSL